MITRRKLITGAAATLAYSRLQARNPRGGLGPASAPVGTWYNVTPANMNLTNSFGSLNFGIQTVGADPANPGVLYGNADVQGIWKSTDYGQTWVGPINTGTLGANIGNGGTGGSGAGITVGSGGVIYFSCIRNTIGGGLGFYKSVNGGVDWVHYNVAPFPTQDCYPPQIDPYNANHLIMPAHEADFLAESYDGGATWTNIPYDSGMNGSAGTNFAFFIDTGSAGTTATTLLWLAQITGGSIGTWRTTNGGTSATWSRVSTNEHAHGCCQIYQVGQNDGLAKSGVMYMAGDYANNGGYGGVLRSADYGQTWSTVGANFIGSGDSVVWGTASKIYTMYSWAQGLGSVIGANYQIASQPGTGTWSTSSVPSGMQTASGQTAVANNGSHNIFVAACWGYGLWRYVEP